MVVYGNDGLDEISMSAPTTVCEIKEGQFSSYKIAPEDFELNRCAKEDLVGGTPDENAEITRRILEGEKGPKRDAVLINSAAALYIAQRVNSIKEGLKLAEEIIDSGKAKEQLEKFIKLSNS
jgi:anthranilate phosphoribosyltransferase